ncbi:MAG: hypothetical protein K6E85_02390 [Lachnospiraceae bacterium]|nr:hypothetical protein [Lachnospiraceae bacterium]
MKKRICTLIAAGITTISMLTACSVAGMPEAEIPESVKNAVEETAEVVTGQDVEGVKETVKDVIEKAEDMKTALPAYSYPGPELFYTVLYDYVAKEIGGKLEGGVVIPDIMVTDVDESDKNDIKVYGDFACYTYTADGDTLERTSGGSYPGCVHIKSTDAGYEVTGMDMTEDGSNFDESVDRIFGDKAEAFRKAYADDAEKQRVWTQTLANYVAANGLDFKFVKDYGWDAIKLPTENIDSFYSVLDGIDDGAADFLENLSDGAENVKAVLASLTYMGGLYISDPQNDLMFSLFRNDTGDVVAVVNKLGNIYYGILDGLPSAKLDDGREYTEFTLEGHTFGYNFGDETNDPFVVDEDGKVYTGKNVDESVAKDMVVETLTGR